MVITVVPNRNNNNSELGRCFIRHFLFVSLRKCYFSLGTLNTNFFSPLDYGL